MRTSRRDKQKMYYALFSGSVTEYELDKDGNKIVDYIDADGNKYYREIGIKQGYSDPVEFYASISGSLSEMRVAEYGLDNSSIYSEIAVSKGKLPIVYGSKIWKTTTPSYKADGTVDVNSADYTVSGVLDEYQNFDFFLLQRNNKYE